MSEKALESNAVCNEKALKSEKALESNEVLEKATDREQIENLCRQMTGMSSNDFTEYAMAIAKQCNIVANRISEEVESIGQLLAQNQDVAKILGISMVFGYATEKEDSKDLECKAMGIIGSGRSVKFVMSELFKEATKG